MWPTILIQMLFRFQLMEIRLLLRQLIPEIQIFPFAKMADNAQLYMLQ